ncbi:hypothetical protein AB6H17_08370 [Proteus vulgaris]
MSLRNANAKNISDSLVVKNTSRFNYGEMDMALTLGSKLMSTDTNVVLLRLQRIRGKQIIWLKIMRLHLKEKMI